MLKIINYIREKSTFRNLFIILFAFSILVNLIVHLFILSSYGKISISPDAKLYLEISYAIRHFSSTIIGVYNPVFTGQDIGHTIMPGYPLLIAPLFENLTLISIFQVLIFSISLYFLFKILYNKLYKVVAFLAIIWIVLTTSWNYHNQPLIESTTISFLIIVLYFLGKYFKDYKVKDFILLAVFFGILISLNNRYIFHFCGLLIFLMFLKIFNRKILIRHIIYGFLVVTLIMLPWHIRQYIVYGKVIIFSASRSDILEKRTKKDDSMVRFQKSYAYREYLKDTTNHPLRNNPKELEKCRLAYIEVQNESKNKSSNWAPSKFQRIYYEPKKAVVKPDQDIASNFNNEFPIFEKRGKIFEISDSIGVVENTNNIIKTDDIVIKTLTNNPNEEIKNKTIHRSIVSNQLRRGNKSKKSNIKTIPKNQDIASKTKDNTDVTKSQNKQDKLDEKKTPEPIIQDPSLKTEDGKKIASTTLPKEKTNKNEIETKAKPKTVSEPKKQISSQKTEEGKQIASTTLPKEKTNKTKTELEEKVRKSKGTKSETSKSNISRKKDTDEKLIDKQTPEIDYIQDTSTVISLKVEKDKTEDGDDKLKQDTIVIIEKRPKSELINRISGSSKSSNTLIIYDTIYKKNNEKIYSDLLKRKPHDITYDDGVMNILISGQSVKRIKTSEFENELEFDKFNDLRIQKLVPPYDEMIDEVLKVHPDLASPEKLKKFMTDFSYHKYKQMVIEKPYPTRLSIIWDRFKEHFVFFRTDFRFPPQWDARIYLPSWYNHPIQMIIDLLNGPFIIILFVPFIFAIKNREFWILSIGLIVLLHIVLHSLLGYLPRYRLTIFPAWITFAAYGYDQITRWIIKLIKEKKLSKSYLVSKFSFIKK